MIETKTFSPNVFNSFAIQAYRLVFGRILPQSLFRDKIPSEADRKAVKTLNLFVAKSWFIESLIFFINLF